MRNFSLSTFLLVIIGSFCFYSCSADESGFPRRTLESNDSPEDLASSASTDIFDIYHIGAFDENGGFVEGDASSISSYWAAQHAFDANDVQGFAVETFVDDNGTQVKYLAAFVSYDNGITNIAAKLDDTLLAGGGNGLILSTKSCTCKTSSTECSESSTGCNPSIKDGGCMCSKCPSVTNTCTKESSIGGDLATHILQVSL